MNFLYIQFSLWEKVEDNNSEDDTNNIVRVIFDANGGTLTGGAAHDFIIENNSYIMLKTDLPVATKEGYIFKGWSADSSCAVSTDGDLVLSGVESLAVGASQSYYVVLHYVNADADQNASMGDSFSAAVEIVGEGQDA